VHLADRAGIEILQRTSNLLYEGMGKGAMGALMKSTVVKRSLVLGSHKTSVSLEDAFWIQLKEIAHNQRVTISKLVAEIGRTREQSNLSSAIRLFVLEHVRNKDKRTEMANRATVNAESAPVIQP
jgi:predicted DNA-binding ribbon-helix-helix protein